jgi:hypothetical protein
LRIASYPSAVGSWRIGTVHCENSIGFHDFVVLSVLVMFRVCHTPPGSYCSRHESPWLIYPYRHRGQKSQYSMQALLAYNSQYPAYVLTFGDLLSDRLGDQKWGTRLETVNFTWSYPAKWPQFISIRLVNSGVCNMT